MSANCDHEFSCSVSVAKFADKPGNGSLDVKGSCVHCGVAIVFHGPLGINAPYPVVSLDQTELRAPVTFGHEPKFSPGLVVLFSKTEGNRNER